MSTVALATLGCKVNQCESAYLEEIFSKSNYQIRPFTEKADLYCINTCAVTSRAAMQSRQLIRRAARQNGAAKIAVLGCYSQVAAEEIATIPGVTHVIGTSEKLVLLDYISGGEEDTTPLIHLTDVRNAPDPIPLVFSAFANRTRAFLKVQDGCDGFCSYCVVPHARGRSRSIPLPSIVEQVERFLAYGYQEIVLTGIHLGQWGYDSKPQLELTELLRSVLRHCPPPRLRLSSLEPGEILPDLLTLIASEPGLCPHLHIPLQSGDPTILEQMNRHYHPHFYREIVLEAIQRIPDLAVGVDVMAGFPGETEERFQNTYRLIDSLPIAYLHIFPFSPRPGTPAATMGEKISPPVIRRRCRLLRELDKRKRLSFLNRFLGKVRPVLVENRQDKATGLPRGFSDNYLPVVVQADSPLENQILLARLDRIEANRLVAIPA
ncbi:MAG: tRNA (N(6)-L-threonylcarbamoyladenosine(37)-C(2))-methylthiotransferase MtaB [Deltaproteobacteria bacterium]|nr:tRNA (N(6)-L-threonylcarbamoyladenosine(37)-C(2))-methylthiotransferase MtaB [Deltaproteobacteria bacterium]